MATKWLCVVLWCLSVSGAVSTRLTAEPMHTKEPAEVVGVAFQKAAPTVCLHRAGQPSQDIRGPFCKGGSGWCPLRSGVCCGKAGYCCPKGHRCRQLPGQSCLMCLPPLHLRKEPHVYKPSTCTHREPTGPQPVPLVQGCGAQSRVETITTCAKAPPCRGGKVKRQTDLDATCRVEETTAIGDEVKSCAQVCCEADPGLQASSCSAFWKDQGCPSRISRRVKAEASTACVRNKCASRCCRETVTQRMEVKVHFRRGVDNFQMFSFPSAQWDHRDNGGNKENPAHFVAEQTNLPKAWKTFTHRLRQLAEHGMELNDKKATSLLVVGHCPTEGDTKTNMQVTRKRTLAAACYLYSYLERHGHKQWTIRLGFVKNKEEWGLGPNADAEARRVDIVFASHPTASQARKFVKDASKPGTAAGMKHTYTAEQGDLQQTCGHWWKANTWTNKWLE